MMCHDEPTLLLFVDRELPEADRLSIGRHLDRCSRCRALVAALEVEDRVVRGVLDDRWWSTAAPAIDKRTAPAVPLTRARLLAALAGAVLSSALVRFLMESAGTLVTPTALTWLSPFHPEGLMNWLSNAVAYGALQADVAASRASLTWP